MLHCLFRFSGSWVEQIESLTKLAKTCDSLSARLEPFRFSPHLALSPPFFPLHLQLTQMPSKKGKKRTTPSDQPQTSPTASDDPSLDPIKLPFSIKEAHQEPTRCRAMVSARICECRTTRWCRGAKLRCHSFSKGELQVETEMIREELEIVAYVDPTNSTRYLRYLGQSEPNPI